ncbi:hypothetical protein TNCV_4709581 [Trichonephila clavipes]|nr:hypothetical protein TNCV_4709581 [Trichonephila clavipes]
MRVRKLSTVLEKLALRWRAVGWMEMGYDGNDAARRLNVSRSVVQRLWDQYQSEDSVSEDLFRPTTSYNTCRLID